MEGHVPVMRDAVLETFQGLQGPLLDGTFGGGGHSEALLENNPQLSIVALDVDPEAQQRAEVLQKKFPQRFQFHPLNFSELGTLNTTFHGILLDLGVSSFQLDTAERGFSFRQDGPLDMRMNPNVGVSAKEFLVKASKEALIAAIRDYGEEPQWRRVVQAILTYREQVSWETTLEFVNFLAEKTPLPRFKKPGIHFATRVFQGLRIAVNDELRHLAKGLDVGFESLAPQGIFGVITFHSLEDRCVKQHFYRWCGRSLNRYDRQPRQFKTVEAELLSRKPLTPSEVEKERNPRSRSAKYRILKKL